MVRGRARAATNVVDGLPRAKRRELVRWMLQDTRDQEEVDKLWYEWRQLPPPSARAALLDELVGRDEFGSGSD